MFIVLIMQNLRFKIYNYLIDINDKGKIVFNSPNFNYNFYVNKKSRNDIYSFNDKSDKS